MPHTSASSFRKNIGFLWGLINGFGFRSAVDPGWWRRTEAAVPHCRKGFPAESPDAKHLSTSPALGVCALPQQLTCSLQGQLTPGTQHNLGSGGRVYIMYSSPILNKQTTWNFGLITHGIIYQIRNSSKQSEEIPTAESGSSFLPPTIPWTQAASRCSCVCLSWTGAAEAAPPVSTATPVPSDLVQSQRGSSTYSQVGSNPDDTPKSHKLQGWQSRSLQQKVISLCMPATGLTPAQA